MTTVLVTGSTGNIGRYVVTELLKREAKVRAVATNIEKAKTYFQTHPNLEITSFDFLQTSIFAAVLQDVKKIFLIRPPQLAKPKKDMLPFLQAAKSAGVEHIVFVSLIGVDKNPVVPHHKIERLILELGFSYTFLRPSFFMQNLNTVHREDISIRNELYVPVGKAKTSFIDTRDIGETAAVCLTRSEHQNKKYELTGSQALSYDEVATIMSEILGREIVYKNPNVVAFRNTNIKHGMPKGFANVMTILYTMTKFGTAKTITHDLEKILTRKPITFEQYVKDHEEDFKKK